MTMNRRGVLGAVGAGLAAIGSMFAVGEAKATGGRSVTYRFAAGDSPLAEAFRRFRKVTQPPKHDFPVVRLAADGEHEPCLGDVMLNTETGQRVRIVGREDHFRFVDHTDHEQRDARARRWFIIERENGSVDQWPNGLLYREFGSGPERAWVLDPDQSWPVPAAHYVRHGNGPLKIVHRRGF